MKREPETAYIKQMEQKNEDIAVEQATVKARNGSHDCRGLFVPNENGDIQVFITNKRITPENAQRWVTHYAYWWWIEAEYHSIKQEFLARTFSKNHTLRFYYFGLGSSCTTSGGSRMSC